MSLKYLYDKIKGKGLVKNFSSKSTWVIETDSGMPKAHVVPPLYKSPPIVDADGFKRVDKGSIRNHCTWWKVPGHIVIRVYDKNSKIDFSGFAYQVSETRFNAGPDKSIFPQYLENEDWAIRMKFITTVRAKDPIEVEYFIESIGWISKQDAIKKVRKGEIDNAVLVQRRGDYYIRSWPDKIKKNNFSNLKN